MKVIGTDKISRFIKRNEGARRALSDWLIKAKAANWKTAADIKATFCSVDHVDAYHVFDIVHNRFRLVALVVIQNGVVIIDRIMTHAEYNRWCRKKR